MQLSAETLCIHGAEEEFSGADPLNAFPSFATAYHQDLDDVVPVRYARWGHNSAEHLEKVLEALDQGRSVVFNSGMAAVSAAVLSSVESGQTIVIGSDIYYETRQISEHLARLNVNVRILEDVEAQLEAAVQGASLVIIESPSNPLMKIHDLRWCSDVAHDAGAIFIVDNSISSALSQVPLELGADMVVASDAKVVGGHNDVILGHASVRDDGLLTRLREWRHLHGSIASPFSCWLAQRSISSLHLRVERQTKNAEAVVEVLAQRPEVTNLRWPGWVKDPQYSIASRQMLGGSGLMSFQFPDRAHLHRFLRASRLIIPATSYGGVQSMANDIGAWPHFKVPMGFVRLSCGCESTADLVQDVAQALDVAATEPAEQPLTTPGSDQSVLG